MKYILTLFILLIAVLPSISKGTVETFKVEYKGALKNMMHKGDISAKADLSDLKNRKHLYALGAIENLKGEIQIFDSKAFMTSVDDGTIVFDSALTKKATLVVYASVKKWVSFDIPDSISSSEQFEVYIEQIAGQNHININEPFPFLIEGKINNFDWHVINWKDGDMEHSHEKHIKSGLHGTIHDKKVHMLGFYSNSHHAIFTHHTTNMHIHFKTIDKKLAGHVDNFTLGTGMLLKLPYIE